MHKVKAPLLFMLGLVSSTACANDLKTIACMYEIKAEAYRFARLQREISLVKADPARIEKLRLQVKGSTKELMQIVQESKSSLSKFDMQKQYQRLEEAVADYLSEGSTGADKSFAALRSKQTGLLKLADDTGVQLVQKSGIPVANAVVLLGNMKINVEKLAYDFEFCARNCKQLTGEVGAIEKGNEDLHALPGTVFKKSAYELAKDQIAFMKMSVDSRLKGDASDSVQANLITTSAHLWEIIDEALDGYTEKAGG